MNDITDFSQFLEQTIRVYERTCVTRTGKSWWLSCIQRGTNSTTTTIQQRGHCQPTGCFLLGLSPQISNFWNTNKAFWLYCVNVVSPNLTRPRQTYLKVTWNTLCMCCKLSTHHMLSWSAGLSSTHAVSLSQYSSEEHPFDHFWFKSSYCST